MTSLCARPPCSPTRGIVKVSKPGPGIAGLLPDTPVTRLPIIQSNPWVFETNRIPNGCLDVYRNTSVEAAALDFMASTRCR